MRFSVVAAVTLLIAACSRGPDAASAAQLRYDGRTLADWWQLRRDPDDATSRQARMAMHVLGGAAVPFLASKAAGPDLGDVIGGTSVLETECPAALPAMRAARDRYPSAALDAAIRRVEAEWSARIQAGACGANGEPVRPGRR